MSSYLGAGDSSEGEEMQVLASGFRSLRLGFGSRARGAFEYVVSLPGTSALGKVNATLALLMIARMQQDRDLQERMMCVAKSLELAPDQTLEVDWGSLCFEAAGSGNIKQLLVAVERRGTHRDLVYEVEAKLWAWGSQERRWADRLPKIRSILARPGSDSTTRNPFYAWAARFELIHDSNIPYHQRLRFAGLLWNETESIVSIEKQLLACASLARWLVRNRSYDFAGLILDRISQLSMSLTDGKRHDCTGLVADLAQKSWFRGPYAQRKTDVA
jgi:hypothetical protein